MTTEENFKDLNQELLDLKTRNGSTKSGKPKSFRSKMFEQSIVKPVPKIFNKEIQLHNPRYEKYLQADIKFKGDLEIPHIWGCIIAEPRRSESPRKNYLKRNIDTPKNLFRTYVNRKNKTMFGVPIIKKVHSQEKLIEYEETNPEKEIEENFEEEVSQFFTELKPIANMNSHKERERMNYTAREKVKRYSDEEQEKFKSSKFSVTKPATSSCTSRFSEILRKDEGNFSNRHTKRLIDNKSLYEMSIDELRESINWKKKFLKCLNESITNARSAHLKWN